MTFRQLRASRPRAALPRRRRRPSRRSSSSTASAAARPRPRETFPADAGVRRLTLECRGHGGSDAGPAHRYSIAAFADDVLALCDALGVDRFVAGGISMGAAVALRIAARHPERVRGLVLVRPAFLFDPAPPNMRPNALVADFLASGPPGAAKDRFMATDCARRLAREAPDNLASLAGFLDRGPSPALAELLRRIANDDPGVSREEAAALRVPALVVGNEADHVHPLADGPRAGGDDPGRPAGPGHAQGARQGRPPRRGRGRHPRLPARAARGANAAMTTERLARLPKDRLLAELSLWSADLGRLEDEVARTEPYADVYHLDVADGHFAPALLFFPDLVARLRRLTERPIHVHLMVGRRGPPAAGRAVRRGRGRPRQRSTPRTATSPRRWTSSPRWACAPASCCGSRPRSRPRRPALERVDFLTLLGTAIGVKGQGLSDEACPRLGRARALLREVGREGEVVLAADGGIREATVPRLRAAGADTVVMGSLAFGAPSLAERIAWLRALPPSTDRAA